MHAGLRRKWNTNIGKQRGKCSINTNSQLPVPEVLNERGFGVIVFSAVRMSKIKL